MFRIDRYAGTIVALMVAALAFMWVWPWISDALDVLSSLGDKL